MTTPLLLLRCVQLGIHISELELLTIGTINDMYSEMQNDENRDAYNTLASQEEWMHFKQKKNDPIHGHSFLLKGFM